jgi:hypothetical protein
MKENMTTDNCGVPSWLILRICERGYIGKDRHIAEETFNYETNDPQLIDYTCDPLIDYRPDYGDEEAA